MTPLYKVAEECAKAEPTSKDCAAFYNLLETYGERSVAINFRKGIGSAYIALLFYVIVTTDQPMGLQQVCKAFDACKAKLSPQACKLGTDILSISLASLENNSVVEFTGRFLSQLDQPGCLEYFFELVKELYLKRTVAYHFGDQTAIPAKDFGQQKPDKELGTLLSAELGKPLEEMQRSSLVVMIKAVMQSLNCAVGLFDRDSEKAEQTTFMIEHNNKNFFNYKKVNLLVWSESQVYLIVPDVVNRTLKLCPQELA